MEMLDCDGQEGPAIYDGGCEAIYRCLCGERVGVVWVVPGNRAAYGTD